MTEIPQQRQTLREEYVGAYRVARQAWYWLRTDDNASRDVVDREQFVQTRLEATHRHIPASDLAWLGNLASESVTDQIDMLTSQN